jgi:hypothetical protein
MAASAVQFKQIFDLKAEVAALRSRSNVAAQIDPAAMEAALTKWGERVKDSIRAAQAYRPPQLQPAHLSPATAVPEPRLTASPTVSMAVYNQLAKGMAYSEVASVIGREGNTLSEKAVNGKLQVVIVWPGDGGEDSYFMATFLDDKLVEKHYRNLLQPQ